MWMVSPSLSKWLNRTTSLTAELNQFYFSAVAKFWRPIIRWALQRVRTFYPHLLKRCHLFLPSGTPNGPTYTFSRDVPLVCFLCVLLHSYIQISKSVIEVDRVRIIPLHSTPKRCKQSFVQVTTHLKNRSELYISQIVSIGTYAPISWHSWQLKATLV